MGMSRGGEGRENRALEWAEGTEPNNSNMNPRLCPRGKRSKGEDGKDWEFLPKEHRSCQASSVCPALNSQLGYVWGAAWLSPFPWHP